VYFDWLEFLDFGGAGSAAGVEAWTQPRLADCGNADTLLAL